MRTGGFGIFGDVEQTQIHGGIGHIADGATCIGVGGGYRGVDIDSFACEFGVVDVAGKSSYIEFAGNFDQ